MCETKRSYGESAERARVERCVLRRVTQPPPGITRAPRGIFLFNEWLYSPHGRAERLLSRRWPPQNCGWFQRALHATKPPRACVERGIIMASTMGTSVYIVAHPKDSALFTSSYCASEGVTFATVVFEREPDVWSANGVALCIDWSVLANDNGVVSFFGFVYPLPIEVLPEFPVRKPSVSKFVFALPLCSRRAAVS